MTQHLFFFVLFSISSLQFSFSQNNPCPENETLINNICRCLPPNVRVNGICQPNCPPLTFLDLKKYSCEPCDSTCSECWGPAPNQCLSCSQGLFNPFLGTCETTCQQGVDGGRGFCVGSAASCSGLTSDTAFINAASGQCNSVCNTPYDVLGLSSNPYNLCGFHQCDESCGLNPRTSKRQCLSAWKAGTCLWCDTRNRVQVVTAIASNRQEIYDCASKPPTNSYLSKGGDKYFMCSPKCRTCSGAPDNCIACDKGLVISEDGTCKQECPRGLSLVYDKDGYATCEAPKQEAPTDENDGKRVADYNNVGGTAVSIGVASLQVFHSGSPSIVSTILLVNLLQYVRYLNIDYPQKVSLAFAQQSQDIGSVNFGPTLPDSIANATSECKALPRFSRFGVQGLFLTNFWRGVTTSLILALGCGIAFLISRIAFKNEKLILARDKIKSFLLWNFILTFILSNIDNVSVFAIVEYQATTFENGLAIFSFIVNLVYLLGSLGLLAYIPVRLYRLRKQDPYKKREDKLKEHDQIKVLFENYKNKYLIQELMIFIIGFRTLINNIVIVAIDSPTLQCSLLLIIGILMLTYLIVFRPHLEILDNVELIIYEVLIFIVNSVCLHLSTLDPSEQSSAETAGTVILICNVIVMTFSIVICALKVIVQVWAFAKPKLAEMRAKRAKAKQAEKPSAKPQSKGGNESCEVVDESINVDIKVDRCLNTMFGSIHTLNTATATRSEVLDLKGSEIKN